MTADLIQENERAFAVLKLKATRDALRIERDCPHSVIVFEKGDAGRYCGPNPSICICLNCRMEYQLQWYHDVERWPTLDRRFIPPHVAGFKSIYHLRAKDSRAIIHSDRYDGNPPTRERRKKRRPNP